MQPAPLHASVWIRADPAVPAGWPHGDGRRPAPGANGAKAPADRTDGPGHDGIGTLTLEARTVSGEIEEQEMSVQKHGEGFPDRGGRRWLALIHERPALGHQPGRAG